jgi:hypothetical protein
MSSTLLSSETEGHRKRYQSEDSTRSLPSDDETALDHIRKKSLITLEHLQKAQLMRDDVEKWCFASFFNDVARGT